MLHSVRVSFGDTDYCQPDQRLVIKRPHSSCIDKPGLSETGLEQGLWLHSNNIDVSALTVRALFIHKSRVRNLVYRGCIITEKKVFPDTISSFISFPLTIYRLIRINSTN